MKIAVVAAEIPHPEGTAVGRDLWAWCEGIRSLGHELQAWVWGHSPISPLSPVPDWCELRLYDPRFTPRWREKLYALSHPRGALARAGWEPPDGWLAVADQVRSGAAVVPFPRSVVTFHYREVPDAMAVRKLRPSLVQGVRAERTLARRAGLVLAYSARVARHLGDSAQVVPVAYPVPPEPLPLNDAPVAMLMADWLWPPNLMALDRLLTAWPQVYDLVPGATLLLAGRMLAGDAVGSLPGVKVLGSVGASVDVLSQASVLAFPCPPSSGPKVKVLEALAYGLAVVTTPAGVEGLVLGAGEGAVVAGPKDFAPALAGLLASPERRASLARSGRAAVETNHSPVASARARLDAFARAFGPG